MKRLAWLGVLALVATACGGTSAAGDAGTTTTAPPAGTVADGSLAGLAFEVHQEPG